jgi:hypothetical protein
VVPGPAAQSFWPFSETPKHFSFSADCAGVVMLAKADVSAAAIASEVMVLQVIGILPL